MKANELMIGDWYRNQEYSENRNWYIDDYYETNADYCEPIPLTDDILKANGWSKEEIPSEYLCEVCGKYTSPDGRVIVCHFDTNSKEWGVHLDNDNFSTVGYFECDYVHELQQALRLCGLNELADNFKLTD